MGFGGPSYGQPNSIDGTWQLPASATRPLLLPLKGGRSNPPSKVFTTGSNQTRKELILVKLFFTSRARDEEKGWS
jgi:hypothetical protein